MKYVIAFIVALMTMLALPACAADAQTAGQVKLDLLKQLEQDGYLSSKLAVEAKEKYVNPRDLAAPVSVGPTKEESFWSKYFSWTNVFKVVAVGLLLVAFGGYIVKFAALTWFVIVQVPKEVYQATFLAATVTATLRPDLIWASQAFYLALFGALANVLLLGWIVDSHDSLRAALRKIFSIGVPVECVISFWGMLYFGALALGYSSELFGFFAAVCLSGIFSFGMTYAPGVLTMYFREKATPAIVLGHLIVLGAYAALKISGQLPAQANLFAAGLEYYCTIAMGVGFLVGASPWFGLRRNHAVGGYLMLFVVVLLAALAGYFFYDMKVIGSIVCVFGVLLALEWIGYFGYQAGALFGTMVLGGTLYGAALLLEHFASFFVLRMA